MSMTIEQSIAAAKAKAEEESIESHDGLPGTLGIIDTSDAVLVIEVASVLGLKNKTLFGAQDVSYEIEGMLKNVQKSRVLVDCGTDAAFHDKYEFAFKDNTNRSCKLTITFFKEGLVREFLGTATISTREYRKQWTRQVLNVPLLDPEHSQQDCGTLTVELYVNDPQHEAEERAKRSAAEQKAADEKRAREQAARDALAAKELAEQQAREKANREQREKEEEMRAKLQREIDEKEAKRKAQDEELARQVQAAKDAAERAERDSDQAAVAAAMADLKKKEDARSKAEKEHQKWLDKVKREVLAGHPVNIEGRAAAGAVDDTDWHKTYQKYTYYCNQMVGHDGYQNYCGECDGRCGPDNGTFRTCCQCKACFRLSRGERLNADGVVARAYKNPKHHSKGAVLHYCGRTADQHGGYVNPCGLCDSVCGPTDGCQCSGCWAIDHEANGRLRPRVALNSDGAPIKFHVDDSEEHSTSGKRSAYCGRKVGQKGYWKPCGECDGRCGPTNGCQCKSCHAYDESQ